MQVGKPSKLGLSDFIGYLRCKSTLMIVTRYGKLKCKYENCNFGAEAPCNNRGKNEVITKKLRNQLIVDEVGDELSFK